MTAACAGSPVPLWDATVDGETEEQREYRHKAALRICARCPMCRECAEYAKSTPGSDGVWGGEVLPTISDKHRRATYPQAGQEASWTPGAQSISLISRAAGPTAKQIRPPAARTTSWTRSA